MKHMQKNILSSQKHYNKQMMNNMPMNVSLMHVAKNCKLSLNIYNRNAKHYQGTKYLDGLANTQKKHDAQALLLKDDTNNTLYVSFRGSSNILDFRDVLNIGAKRTKYGLVHSGFFDQYESLRDMLLPHVQDPNIHHIFCSGHSMGGAVALIASVHIKDAYPQKNVNCYSYGSPVAACRLFFKHAEELLDELISVEHENDIIPWIPLNPMLTTYRNKIVLKKDGDIHPFDIYGNHSCVTYYRLLSDLGT